MAPSACKQLRSMFDKMFGHDKDLPDIVCVEKEVKPAVDVIIRAVNAAKARATEPMKIIDIMQLIPRWTALVGHGPTVSDRPAASNVPIGSNAPRSAVDLTPPELQEVAMSEARAAIEIDSDDEDEIATLRGSAI
ncbi:hypothetical protein MMC10_008887 [Thelotrema lepadinum]|nr:hypothetical protein [Thelotrema lepadinum]